MHFGGVYRVNGNKSRCRKLLENIEIPYNASSHHPILHHV